MLQGVLHVNNTVEFLSKCHFHTFVTQSVLHWLKSWSANGASHHSAFMSRRPTISHTFLASFGYPMDKFSFKEMRTWGRSKIKSYCICVWYESGEIGGRSSTFPCVTPVVEIVSLDRVALRISWNINDRVPLRKQPTTLTCWLFPQKGSTRHSTGLQVRIWLEVLWVWGVGGQLLHGIRSLRLVHKEVVEVGSNYKKSYLWWPGNLACGDSTGSNWIGKGQGRVSARLVWGKGREGAVWLTAHGVPSDHWANGDYVDVVLMCGERGWVSLGSWFYPKEWVWSLGTKIVLKWNFIRMTFQEFNIRYILF